MLSNIYGRLDRYRLFGKSLSIITLRNSRFRGVCDGETTKGLFWMLEGVHRKFKGVLRLKRVSLPREPSTKYE